MAEEREKYCSHCKTKKGTFIKYATNKYGKHYYNCNPCNNKRLRNYRKTKKGKQVFYELMRRQDEKFKDKRNARAILNYHLKMGHIKKPKKCTKCKENKKLGAHHKDYCFPLRVRWVCRGCHREFHKKHK